MFLRLTLLGIGLASSYIGGLCFQNGSGPGDMAVAGGALLIGILCFFFLAKGIWRFFGCMTTFVIIALIVGALFFFMFNSDFIEKLSAEIKSKIDSQKEQTTEQEKTEMASAALPANPVPAQPVPTVGLPPGMKEQMQQIQQAIPPSVITGKISSIRSGDVFRIGQHTVRLYGLAAPLIDQICQDSSNHTYECGYVSARMLKDFVNNDDVQCRVMNINAQNELMAACSVGDFDIGAAMVEAGWAIALPAVTQIYLPYQQKAQNGRQGMWDGSFQMPWEWGAQQQQAKRRAKSVKVPKIKPSQSQKKGKSVFDYL